MIRTRMAKPIDAGVATPLMIDACPPTSAIGSGLSETLAMLLAEGRVRWGLIEVHDNRDGWQLCATGLSAFVSDAVVEALMADTEPFGAARILARTANGERSLFLDESEIAAGNTHGTLNLFVIGFSARPPADPSLMGPMLARAIAHFVEAHRGYHLKTVIREDAEPIASTLVASGMRAIRHFQPDGPTNPSGRILMVRNRDDNLPMFPDSITTQLFAYAQPNIHFALRERQLLEAAMEGLSDDEIGVALDLSVNTIKQMWKAIYERTAQRMPLALGSGIGGPMPAGVRGVEKRRHLLSWLREHPEELRPHLRPK